MDVQCELCPKGCVIEPGQSGECRIRMNVDGKLVAVTYGHPCAAHDPPAAELVASMFRSGVLRPGYNCTVPTPQTPLCGLIVPVPVSLSLPRTSVPSWRSPRPLTCTSAG